MTTILRIDASSRSQGSLSRALGDHFEQAWLRRHAGHRVARRDLAVEPVPHIAADTIAGFYTAPAQMTETLRRATALSDHLIGELQAADTLLLTVPMYNFSVPSALKAWIDHIVRIGHTFAYDGSSFTGLVKTRRAFVACSFGAAGYRNGGPFAGFNFVEPYLGGLLGFLGIGEVKFFAVQATTADATTVEANLAAARAEIDEAVVVAA